MKDRDDLNRKLAEMLAKQDPRIADRAVETGGNRPVIELDAALVEDLGLDSFDRLELTIAIEDQFNIELADDEVADLKTFGDLCEYVWKTTLI
jgi:acyl carrier protein